MVPPPRDDQHPSLGRPHPGKPKNSELLYCNAKNNVQEHNLPLGKDINKRHRLFIWIVYCMCILCQEREKKDQNVLWVKVFQMQK